MRCGPICIRIGTRRVRTHLEQRERDRARDARAIALGYLPLRFSYRQVMFEWEEVAETVTAVVRRRDHMKKPVRDLWLGALDEPGFGDYRDV